MIWMNELLYSEESIFSDWFLLDDSIQQNKVEFTASSCHV